METRKIATMMLALALAFTLTPAAAFAATSSLDAATPRLAGNEAYETAVEISRSAFPGSCDNVVIARDDDFADAMSATGLAGTLECPILTVPAQGKSAPASVRSEIERLGATKAYVVGGPGALGNEALSGIGIKTERIYGDDSWDTSAKCAQAISRLGGNPNGEAIVATSHGFQDALSASSYAYRYKVPIFLQTSGRELPGEAKAVLDGLSGYIFVLGGNGAVPASSVSQYGSRVIRIFGNDGYDTSNQVATYFARKNKLDKSTVVIANGSEAAKGVDALAGAALAGVNGCAIVLANDNPDLGRVSKVTITGVDSEGAAAYVQENSNTIAKAYVLGGAVVAPDSLRTTVSGIIGASATTGTGSGSGSGTGAEEPAATGDSTASGANKLYGTRDAVECYCQTCPDCGAKMYIPMAVPTGEWNNNWTPEKELYSPQSKWYQVFCTFHRIHWGTPSNGIVGNAEWIGCDNGAPDGVITTHVPSTIEDILNIKKD